MLSFIDDEMIRRFSILGIIMLLLFGCTSKQSSFELKENATVHCTKGALLASQNFGNKEYSAKNFTLETTVPSEGSGGEAYFRNGKLEKIIAGYYGAIGKTELQFWFLDEKRYIVDVLDYQYEHAVSALRISHLKQQRIFVCNDKILSCDKLNECSRFDWVQSELGRILKIIATSH